MLTRRTHPQARFRLVPWSTALLGCVLVAVYAYECSLTEGELRRFAYQHGLHLPSIRRGYRSFSGADGLPGVGWFLARSVAPYITHCLLHSGPIHLATSVLGLWVFGSRLESRASHLRFAALFVASGVLGGIAHTWWGDDPRVVRLGATVPVAAAGVCYLLLSPRANVSVLVLPLPLLVRVPVTLAFLVWAALQFHKVQDFLGLDCGVSIGYLPAVVSALIGGLLGGLLLGGMSVGPVLDRPDRRGRRPPPRKARSNKKTGGRKT